MDNISSSLADLPPIGEDKLHRQRVPLMRKAEENYPGAGWVVYQLWRNYNKQLFGRQMEHCEIQFSSVPKKRFGLWRAEENAIVLDRSLLHQHGKVWRLYHAKLGSLFPPDVLLRQVVLQYIEEVRGLKITEKSTQVEPLGEDEQWIEEINRLSETMELERATSLEKRNWWPYSVRQESYYEKVTTSKI